jgi:hypothetical protein
MNEAKWNKYEEEFIEWLEETILIEERKMEFLKGIRKKIKTDKKIPYLIKLGLGKRIWQEEEDESDYIYKQNISWD